MGKSYHRGKSKSWTKVFQNSFKDLCDGILKKFDGGVVIRPKCCNRGARICIYVLIVVTLLFSGLGFYSWIILGMLILVLQFV